MNDRTASDSKVDQAVKGCGGLLLAAFVVATVVTVWWELSYQDWEGVSIVFLLTWAAATAFTLILGVPFLLLGIFFRLVRWWSCLLISFLIGFLPSALSDIPHWSDVREDLVVGGGLGTVGGITFWLLWHFWLQRSKGVRATSVASDNASG